MKFSILVPVYNVEQYLEQCVESLLNQTYNGEYEIILVNDGSTDSSGKICDKYAENHPDKIRVIHKKNEGLVSARQSGINLAQGEYCLFVDSDDFAEDNLLSEISLVLSEESQAEMVIYSFSYYHNEEKKPRKKVLNENKSIYSGENKKILYEALISTPLITALWIKAVKTEILKNDPTDYSLYYDKNMAEDWFRSIHLLTASEKIVYINKPLYNYRTNEASISRSYRPETIEKKNTLYVYDRFIEYLPCWKMNDEEHIHRLNARWLNETVYTFTQYYENANSAKNRKAVMQYNWNSMLPESAKKPSDNPYENKTTRKLYIWLTEKKYLKIRIYFIQKNVYKKLRRLKARLLDNG